MILVLLLVVVNALYLCVCVVGGLGVLVCWFAGVRVFFCLQFHAAAFMSLHVVFATQDLPLGPPLSPLHTLCVQLPQHFQLFSTLKILDNEPEVKSLNGGFLQSKLCFSCGKYFVKSEIFLSAGS